MLHRNTAMTVAAALLVGCAGEANDETAGAANPASTSQDEQAVEELRAYWETHYNMHHADMVATTYADSAWTLPADGGWLQGRAAIEADLVEGMAASPTATVGTSDLLLMEDMGVGMGTYTVTVNTEAGDVSWSGSWLNILTKASGEWKILGSITNYDGEPLETVTWRYFDGQPAEDGTMTDVTDYFATHWNMGHPSMVADVYTDDAVAAFAGSPMVEGRAGIEEALATRIESGVKLSVHDVGTLPLGEGWVADGGWYQLDGPDGGGPVQAGSYITILRQQQDGSWKIHWMLTNAQPPVV